MDVSSRLSGFQSAVNPYLEKGAQGALSLKDMKALDTIVGSFKSQIPDLKHDHKIKADVTESPDSIEGMLTKVELIKQKNFDIQLAKFTESVKKGELNFSDLVDNALPFSEKMEILLKLAPRNSKGMIELTIKGVPTKKGTLNGEFHLKIKEDPILDSDQMVLSQIKDPVYREQLLNHKEQKHYSFEFFDVGRSAEINRKNQELITEEKALNKLGPLLSEYSLDRDIDVFNRKLTPEERVSLEIPANMTPNDINNLAAEYEDKLMMFPFKADSIQTEFAKATIRGRFCEDGSVGELKSVNIHSEDLKGKELMDFWDKFCGFMEPEQVYLEDDAKIEGKTGSYNMQLFRLMGMPNRASWYLDGWNYEPYQSFENTPTTMQNPKGYLQENIAPFKDMPLKKALELVNKEGMKVDKRALQLILEHLNSVGTLGELVKQLGDGVMKGQEWHKDIDHVLNIIRAIADYKGVDQELLALKTQAEAATNTRFFRKSYV